MSIKSKCQPNVITMSGIKLTDSNIARQIPVDRIKFETGKDNPIPCSYQVFIKIKKGRLRSYIPSMERDHIPLDPGPTCTMKLTFSEARRVDAVQRGDTTSEEGV